MTLVVEDGTGVTNANTYLSESDANIYHAGIGNTSWDGLSSANKEFALRNATRYLDTRWKRLFRGRRKEELQALAWPRYLVVDWDGFPIDADLLPQDLKDACAELALVASTEELYPDQSAGDQGVKREMIKAGSVEVSTEYIGGKVAGKSFRRVVALLRDLVFGEHMIERS